LDVTGSRAPAVALANRAEWLGRWEPIREVEMPDVIVLPGIADQLPSDVDLKHGAAAPVVRSPLEEEHVAVGFQIHIVGSKLPIELDHPLDTGAWSAWNVHIPRPTKVRFKFRKCLR